MGVNTGGPGGAGDGGAIYNQGTLTINFSTFTGNQATGGSGDPKPGQGLGGAIFGAASLEGTILASSSNPDNCNSGITDDGYNIADDSSCKFTMGSSQVITPTSSISLVAGGPVNNGGPTFTIGLQTSPASPAIDIVPVADCPGTDQRGFTRPDSGESMCDAGAYESGAIAPFAGVPGKANCHGKSVSALSQQYGTLGAAASALGFPSVKALQSAINAFCAGSM